MRILVISNSKKNGYGESTRPLFFSKHFADKGHSVLHISKHQGTLLGMQSLGFDPEKAASNFVYRVYSFFNLLISTRLFSPEIIYVHQLNNWNWVRLSRSLPNAITVFDAHTSLLLEHRNFAAGKNQGHLVTREREFNALREPDHVITVSRESRAFFFTEYGINHDQISVVKNATNLRPIDQVLPTDTKEVVVCCAVLPQDGFEGNRLALEMLLNIALSMSQTDPTVAFKVIGGGDKPSDKPKNVTYTGFVDDFRGEILQSDICLVPYPKEAVCGGVRNKVCDFLALGKPIISTSEGMRGFDDCEENKHYLLAETVNDFQSAIKQLAKNSALRHSLGSEAHKLGFEYQWPKKASEVLVIFDRLLKRKRNTSD